jgi:molecular chaperone GrpE (heat shock protein)
MHAHVYTSTATQVAQLTDSLKRALAEMENVRARAAREVDGAKKFAVQVCVLCRVMSDPS